MVARRLMLVVIVCTVTFSLFPKKIHLTGKDIVTLLNTIETKNCFVSYVLMHGNKYLVKQKKDPKKQLAVVRDALAAWIAEILGVAHEVDIISCNATFPGKIKASWPATIHTLAPGKTVREQRSSRYNALRLRQFWARVTTFSEKGLTRAIITYMTWHRQLPVIVALDLMIGNSDRHCGNLCYDPETDTFCAIDMDDTFNKDLCLLAYKKLKLIVEKDTTPFTRQEICALARMRDTLKLLVRRYRPQDVISKLHSFAQKAGFSRGNKMYNDRERRKLLFYEQMIISTHMSANKLIALLDKIVARTSRERERSNSEE